MTASHNPDSPSATPPTPMFSVAARPPAAAPVPATSGPNPDFPHNAAPGTPAPTPSPAPPVYPAPTTSAPTAPPPVPPAPPVAGPTGPRPAEAEAEAPEAVIDAAAALAEVPTAAPLLPARTAPTAGLALARANDGLPMVLDPFAVASRAVLVLIGSIEPAKHIARTAIEMSIEHDSSAAIDVVIPRAIDLVLRRAAHLVSIGAGPKVVDHYTERLELWRRLARRSGLEPAAIVLTLAPFPIPTVASMLRVSLAEVEACIDDWYAGIDPDDHRPRSIAPASEQVVDLRDAVRTPAAPVNPAAPVAPVAPMATAAAGVTVTHARTPRRGGWARWRVRQA